MDWNYLYSVVALVIGGLAGFQGVYERYEKDSAHASTTLPGFFYLLTRAIFPAGVFAGLYASRFIENNLLIASLACGTGAELFLRTKFFIKQEEKAPGDIEDVLKGPLDLLRWYQDLFLGAASTSLAHSKKAFVDKHLPAAVKFQDLCERLFKNIDAYDPPPADLKTEVEKLRDEFEKKIDRVEVMIQQWRERTGGTREEAIDYLSPFSPEVKDLGKVGKAPGVSDPARLDQQYRYRLGYLVYNHVGRKGFTTLLSS